MSKSTAQLLQEALQLPEVQRATLVVELLESLESSNPPYSRSDADWLTEIERRARAAQGGAAGVPWEEAHQQALRRLPQS